jgi:hypothetical protein
VGGDGIGPDLKMLVDTQPYVNMAWQGGHRETPYRCLRQNLLDKRGLITGGTMRSLDQDEIWSIQKWAFLVLAILTVLTPLIIYFVYGRLLFEKWPWFRFSIAMSILTCLWVFCFWFFHLAGDDRPNPLAFAMIAIPVDCLLIYPGAGRVPFTGNDDHFGPLIIALEIVHGLGFFILSGKIRRVLERKGDRL